MGCGAVFAGGPTTEAELHTLQRRTEHLARLERDRDALLESYTGLMPDAIDALGPQERYGVYRMIGMKAHLATYGSFDPSGDVMNISQMKLSSS